MTGNDEHTDSGQTDRGIGEHQTDALLYTPFRFLIAYTYFVTFLPKIITIGYDETA